MKASEELLKQHYADLAGKPFFNGLVEFIGSGPVVPMVWEGKNVVKQGRQMMGQTNPLTSLPGSDSVDSAKKEIGLWFKEDELQQWKSPLHAA